MGPVVRQIFYSLRFNGKVRAEEGEPGLLRMSCTATGCVCSTLIGPEGFAADVKPSAGDLAFLESALRVTGPGAFEEHGTITFGSEDEHELQFKTKASGHLAPSPDPGTVAGTARWEIEGGRGQFAGARGFIQSSFTLTSWGRLDEFHNGLIFLP